MTAINQQWIIQVQNEWFFLILNYEKKQMIRAYFLHTFHLNTVFKASVNN